MLKSGYVNTDFDLKSKWPFDRLQQELSRRCCVLHYALGNDGYYYASFEADNDDETGIPAAERDILWMIGAINHLSDAAKAELEACDLREFNIGFYCGDSWAYRYALSPQVVSAVVATGCSFAVTLYPMRHPDGTPR